MRLSPRQTYNPTLAPCRKRHTGQKVIHNKPHKNSATCTILNDKTIHLAQNNALTTIISLKLIHIYMVICTIIKTILVSYHRQLKQSHIH